MWRRFGVVLAIGALVASGCGSSDKKSGNEGPRKAAATTVRTNVDGKTDAFNGSFVAFFPNEETVHPGDTVEFDSTFTGEPHTVTLGKLVDAGLAAADKLGPDAQDEPPELKTVPLLLPDGPGDAIQAAAQPCFLANGEPPANGDACPKVAQPEFDGAYALYSSGWLADGEKFSVKLADDLAPGTYRFFCELHRAGMQGKINVVAKSAKAQTAAEVAAAGMQQLDDTVAKLKPAADALAALTADTAQAGAAVEKVEGLVNQFGPKEITIPIGGSVTWDVQGPHTISLNASEDLKNSFLERAADGGVHIKQDAAAPAGGPGADPNAPPPEGPTVIDGATWDGTGFRSSGLLLGFGPPGTLKFKLTFSKAGTYKYACLIHPNMEGTVKVG